MYWLHIKHEIGLECVEELICAKIMREKRPEMGYLDEMDEWGMHPLGGPYLGLQGTYLGQIKCRLGVVNVTECSTRLIMSNNGSIIVQNAKYMKCSGKSKKRR